MRELTDGSTAIVRGALAAGCSFFAGYPITPASPILMRMLAELPKVGGVAVQGEDEIASLGMCIGAAMGGARAMTATSGPGISLYSENIGLAIMGEVPLVIVDVQRLGPSTGGATTVSQGDVQFVRWGTAGGYPVIVLSPSSIPECYSLTMKAFDLSERFRCPVFLLTDKEVALTSNTVPVDEYGEVAVRDRKGAGLAEPGEAGGATQAAETDGSRVYRYEPADQVPPMRLYGEGDTVRFTGSTHDERAIITKDRSTIGALNRHLIEKIEAHRDEIEMVEADLEAGAETLWISYGVTAGAMREAVALARQGGKRVSALTILSLWPVPESAIERAVGGRDDSPNGAGAVERIVVAELNHGLYRREIERLAPRMAPAGVEVVGLHRIDGDLLTPRQFLETLP